MNTHAIFAAAVVSLCSPVIAASEQSAAKQPSPSPTVGSSLKDRRAAAKSVKVMTGILGVELGSTLEKAHARLDPLNDPARPPKEQKEREEGSIEHKVLWQLKATDYSSIYVKADREGQIEYITGFLRPGRELPFEKVGEVAKAPVRSETTVVWDVLRRKRKPMRVVATGQKSRASVIKLFVVKSTRPWSDGKMD